MIKRYFVENCISIRQWAKKHNLPQRMTYAVINGDVFGKYNTANGSAKRVFEALLAEGIIKELPEGLRQDNNEEKAS
ncbi:hypothetical protein [Campylobacter sp. FOBRC14]|uniref:hypothetical protein n=1 Tax=Campylobacter sp. FOBRC14 TaxID=936554 RepID=UPI00027A36B8|nr:hypothetical protein [Campylobacter sp. FOBRC14]EJP75745.1 hypothetical protein HMPREF1139_0690 [Campylobacter sp. FOBRC14]